MRTGRTIQKIERRPTGQAELPVFADDHAAARAARGQRIIDNRTRNGPEAAGPWRSKRAFVFDIPSRRHSRLVQHRRGRHKQRMSQPSRPLFSVARQRAQRDRMARLPASANFLAPIIAETLLDRLAMVTREFSRTLLVGAHDRALTDHLRGADGDLTIIEAGPQLAADNGALVVEADAIDLPLASFDLIVWPGGLDSVNDVPGALVRLRALLAPDGLLLGAFLGDGSLPRLRRAVMTDGVRQVARLHPQIDLAAMGNLLQRVGFTLPVVDVEALTVRYGDWFALVRDLRASGLASRLALPPPPLTRAEAARIAAAFAVQADPDGRIAESFRLVHFSGWAPHPDQPLPARRGSGTASLADALKSKR